MDGINGLETGIVTDDIDVLTTFYEKAFGFRVHSVVVFPQGEVRRMRRGEARLKVYQPTELPMHVRPEPFATQRGFGYCALLVTDAAAFAALAESAGGDVVVPPTAHRPGACYALVRDPQGNTWELLQESDAA